MALCKRLFSVKQAGIKENNLFDGILDKFYVGISLS
jgi:hypothetical protein